MFAICMLYEWFAVSMKSFLSTENYLEGQFKLDESLLFCTVYQRSKLAWNSVQRKVCYKESHLLSDDDSLTTKAD